MYTKYISAFICIVVLTIKLKDGIECLDSIVISEFYSHFALGLHTIMTVKDVISRYKKTPN